jgi:ComF family protein
MRGEAAELVRLLKYSGWTALAARMGAALLGPARNLARRADVPPSRLLLVPVPITPARHRERGFNQAHLLADGLSDAMDARMTELLERGSARRSQVHLRRRDRLANVPGSFRMNVRAGSERNGSRRAVLLVDDVVTTGATAGACATALAEAGWRSIGIVSFARAWRTFEPSSDSPSPM